MNIRNAAISDSEPISRLLLQLGHPISEEATGRQLETLASTGNDRVLVAELDGVVVGVMSLHWSHLLHRERPIGRITALVIEELVRGQGIGRSLVLEAHRIFDELGCGAVEVTSNVKRTEAHIFYRTLGYEQPSAYFRRVLR